MCRFMPWRLLFILLGDFAASFQLQYSADTPEGRAHIDRMHRYAEYELARQRGSAAICTEATSPAEVGPTAQPLSRMQVPADDSGGNTVKRTPSEQSASPLFGADTSPHPSTPPPPRHSTDTRQAQSQGITSVATLEPPPYDQPTASPFRDAQRQLDRYYLPRDTALPELSEPSPNTSLLVSATTALSSVSLVSTCRTPVQKTASPAASSSSVLSFASSAHRRKTDRAASETSPPQLSPLPQPASPVVSSRTDDHVTPQGVERPPTTSHNAATGDGRGPLACSGADKITRALTTTSCRSPSSISDTSATLSVSERTRIPHDSTLSSSTPVGTSGHSVNPTSTAAIEQRPLGAVHSLPPPQTAAVSSPPPVVQSMLSTTSRTYACDPALRSASQTGHPLQWEAPLADLRDRSSHPSTIASGAALHPTDQLVDLQAQSVAQELPTGLRTWPSLHSSPPPHAVTMIPSSVVTRLTRPSTPSGVVTSASLSLPVLSSLPRQHSYSQAPGLGGLLPNATHGYAQRGTSDVLGRGRVIQPPWK